MIGRLAGRLLRKDPTALLVDVYGVGFEVIVSLKTFCRLPEPGNPIELDIHTHVRENALDLYGFLDPLEKQMFASLITVAGIGPRMAIAILSGLSPQELRDAIASGDVNRLVAVPGVGRKTAQRLVTELRDRVPASANAPTAAASGAGSIEAQAVSALVNLGYPEATAREAVAGALADGGTALADVIRGALRRMAVRS